MDKKVNHLSLLSDAELAAKTKTNPECFGELVRRHGPALLAFFISKAKDYHRAEDLQQKTLIRAYVALHKGQYREENKFHNWIGVIARNVWVDYVRNFRKRNFKSLEAAMNVSEEIIVNNRPGFLKRLGKGLRKLGRQYRLVIILHSFKKMTYEEIAKRLHISVRTAREYHYEALVRLKSFIL
jgi:RNA polymerase sigma-70 factor, ECF subfamily